MKKIHDESHRWLLAASRLPARLTAGQTAALLGFEEHHLPILVARGLIASCGNARGNSTKFFAAKHVLELADDVGWLGRATKAVAERFRRKNEAALARGRKVFLRSRVSPRDKGGLGKAAACASPMPARHGQETRGMKPFFPSSPSEDNAGSEGVRINAVEGAD